MSRHLPLGLVSALPPRPLFLLFWVQAPKEPVKYDTAALQFKLLDGGSIQGSFAATAKLSEVVEYVRVHRTDGNTPFRLVLSYPRTVYGSGDMDKTLEELSLVPRSSLLLVPEGSAHTTLGSGGTITTGAASGQQQAGLLGTAASYASWAVNSAVGTAGWLIGRGGSTSSQQPQPSGPQPQQPGSGAAAGRKQGPMTLGDLNKEAEGGKQGGDGKNQFWNGNSTQTDG